MGKYCDAKQGASIMSTNSGLFLIAIVGSANRAEFQLTSYHFRVSTGNIIVNMIPTNIKYQTYLFFFMLYVKLVLNIQSIDNVICIISEFRLDLVIVEWSIVIEQVQINP